MGFPPQFISVYSAMQIHAILGFFWNWGQIGVEGEGKILTFIENAYKIRIQHIEVV